MNDYLEPVKNVLHEQINKYKLTVIALDEQTISLYKKDKYSFEISFYQDEINFYYFSIISTHEAISYNLTNYIGSKTLDIDRENMDLNYRSIYERRILVLKILNNVLNNSCKSILSGGISLWFEDYKNSPYFSEPRLVERRI